MEDQVKKDLFFVVGFLVILAMLWYFTGGQKHQAATSGPFLGNRPEEEYKKEFVTKSEQMQKGTLNLNDATTSAPIKNSKYQGMVMIDSTSYADKTNPQEEYITLEASSQNTSPINISHWTLEGKGGLKLPFGTASYLPYPSQINTQGEIFIQPGDTVFVVTGQSPIGTNFRLNKCVGYFSQYQDFIPNISRQCPYLKNEKLPTNLNDACIDYIDRMSRCKVETSPPLPPKLTPECRNLLIEKANYNFCVNNHKGDTDFYLDEWRIYLNRSAELWKQKRETIILRDEEGKVVDWRDY